MKEANSNSNKTKKILVVDDDAAVVQLLDDLFGSHGIETLGCSNGAEALFALETSGEVFPVIILDYVLPDISGDDLTKKVKALSPSSFIYTLSGAPSTLENAVNSIKNGADNFFHKNTNFETLEDTVLAAFKEYEGTRTSYVDEQIKKEIVDNNVITVSKKMKVLIAKAIQSSRNKVSVLITGETGTGKEQIAQLISKKVGGPFLPVDCGQFVGRESLLESELFGHEKGAFTDAKATKKGIFEEASGGVVFFDEVDRMSLVCQAKLLRAIQEKKIKRVGGVSEVAVDIKIIASAKPTIREQRDADKFLTDLYGRLNVIRLDIPPLRQRVEDIEPLIAHFSAKHIEDVGEEKNFEPAAISLLQSYHWPENMRELENFYLRLGIHTEASTIRTRDLVEHIESFRNLRKAADNTSEMFGAGLAP